MLPAFPLVAAAIFALVGLYAESWVARFADFWKIGRRDTLRLITKVYRLICFGFSALLVVAVIFTASSVLL